MKRCHFCHEPIDESSLHMVDDTGENFAHSKCTGYDPDALEALGQWIKRALEARIELSRKYLRHQNN